LHSILYLSFLPLNWIPRIVFSLPRRNSSATNCSLSQLSLPCTQKPCLLSEWTLPKVPLSNAMCFVQVISVEPHVIVVAFTRIGNVLHVSIGISKTPRKLHHTVYLHSVHVDMDVVHGNFSTLGHSVVRWVSTSYPIM